MCEWLGVDIDIKYDAKGFCSRLWSVIGTQYFPFMTLNKKWRVIEFLDEPLDVKLAHARAKALQERIKTEKAARKAERKRLKAKWKKACSDDPESKACKEGKPSEKIKKSLLKIKKKLGG